MKALLIIDLQAGFMHPVVEPIVKTIVDFAKNFDGLIVATKFVNDSEKLFVKQLNWHRFNSADDTKLVEPIASLSNVEVIEHNTYTCLNDELRQLLKFKSVDEVFIAGVFTDVCVTKTAMDCFDSDYKTTVLQDMVQTLHGRDVHEATIKSLRHIIGNDYVVNSDIAKI